MLLAGQCLGVVDAAGRLIPLSIVGVAVGQQVCGGYECCWQFNTFASAVDLAEKSIGRQGLRILLGAKSVDGG